MRSSHQVVQRARENIPTKTAISPVAYPAYDMDLYCFSHEELAWSAYTRPARNDANAMQAQEKKPPTKPEPVVACERGIGGLI